MSASDFFSRWARREVEQEPAQTEAVSAEASAPAPELPPPTLEDVAALGHDADFSRFVKPGVDETVRRSAMKKLFTDPHFNVMDGLDIYIGDYSTFEPLPPAMLAMLVHAKALLDPLGHLQQPAMTMLHRLEQLAQDEPAAGERLQPEDEVPSAEAHETVVPEPDELRADGSQAIENPVVDIVDNPGIDNPNVDTPSADTLVAEPLKDPAARENDHII